MRERRPYETVPLLVRRLSGLRRRRVEENVKSRDLAVACDDEIHAGVNRRLSFRSRAPRQPPGIVQHLGCAMMRIDKMGMCRPEIACELVYASWPTKMPGGTYSTQSSV